MHVILCPFGSAGDVYPFLGLGLELRRRGHRITLITSEQFAGQAQRAGFEFAPCLSSETARSVVADPDLWHPRRSLPLLAARCVLPAMPVTYRLIAERHVPGETAVVAGSLAFGARIAQERLGLPLATLHLQPAVLRSRFAPPVLAGLGWLQQLPVALRPALFRLMDFVIDRQFAGPLNDFRATLGLAPISRVMDQWWHSPRCTLALFPPWYAAPQPDWPAQVHCTDFPRYDAGELETSACDVDAMMAPDEAPVVFTSGSAMATGHDFFAASVGACVRLGLRGLLVTRFPEQLPSPLPALVQHLDYAPFDRLLPRAAAFVHHGGIGTVAAALRAGVPQLISPCSYDQFDNAARVMHLGAGRMIGRGDYTAANVADVLQGMLASTALRQAAAACATHFGAEDPLLATADAIERSWR
jgi:rhamnosyltransferase subunit B